MKPVSSLLLAAALACASPAANAETPTIIAKVDGEDVTAATLAPFFDALGAAERQALRDNPALLNQTVRGVILRRLLVKEALAAGWDKRPEVAEQVERAQEAVVVESYLREICKPPAGFPSDSEVASVYEARKAELRIPKQLQLAQIYVPLTASADKVQTAAAKTLADQIAAKLKKPDADFLEVAAEVASPDGSGVRAGEVGWVALDGLKPEIRKAVEGLGKGATTPAVQLDDGLYFVKVLDVREARTPPLDEVREQIADALREERLRLNREAYLARLARQSPVSINELSLPSLLKANP